MWQTPKFAPAGGAGAIIGSRMLYYYYAAPLSQRFAALSHRLDVLSEGLGLAESELKFGDERVDQIVQHAALASRYKRFHRHTRQ